MRAYKILETTKFIRDLKKILKQNPKLEEVVTEMYIILEVDPLNISRVHNIKKLTDTKEMTGQWRLRKGDYRLRYDVFEKTVLLHSINHRKDAY